MSAQTTQLLRLLLILACVHATSVLAEGAGNFVYLNYPYTVKQTGDNYTFEFDKTPGEGKKIQAAVHVLQSVYADDSINPSYSETFMKETALCFVFDSTWYSYRACFLPNDYSPGKRDRFWGFVSKLPNAKWLLSRNLLPAVLAIGLFWFFANRQQQA